MNKSKLCPECVFSWKLGGFSKVYDCHLLFLKAVISAQSFAGSVAVCNYRMRLGVANRKVAYKSSVCRHFPGAK